MKGKDILSGETGMHFTTAESRDELFDKAEAQKHSPAKFEPYFPMKAQKALIKLTGRLTIAKALASYKWFYNARRRAMGKGPCGSQKIFDYVMKGDWTAEFFRDEALEYLRYPRKGFNLAKQGKRIFEFFSEFRLRLPDFDSDNK